MREYSDCNSLFFSLFQRKRCSKNNIFMPEICNVSYKVIYVAAKTVRSNAI